MTNLLLLFALPHLAPAADFQPEKLKAMLCPFNATELRKLLDHEALEHGGLEEIRGALEEQRHQYGPCEQVRPVPGPDGAFELMYRDANVPLDITANGGKIQSLVFGVPEFRNDSAEKLLAAVKKLPYKISYAAITEKGEGLVSHEADLPLSISRSNQIFLLRAVKNAVAKGKLRLSDTVPLEEKAFVPTFGILHFWKPGTLLSVDSLLHLLVSEKDLTASDLLLDRLGREAPAAYGKSLAPFLSFREFYQLAELPKEKLGNREAVRALLPELAARPMPSSFNADRPDLVKSLGWFASAREVCESALSVKDDLWGRNQRLNGEYKAVQPKRIGKFALVQSRDSGVSQITEVFEVDGKWVCVTVTANHSGEVEEGTFSGLASRLTALAARGLDGR